VGSTGENPRLVTESEFKAGDTFYTRSILRQSEPHLFILLTSAVGDPAKAIVVNFSTYVAETCTDSTLVLGQGSHPFLKHDTYLVYPQADWIDAVALAVAVTEGSVRLHERCRPEVLRKIQEGLLESSEPSRALKHAFVAWYREQSF